MSHDCIPSCTVYTVVQEYALACYYCFHLTSGTSTAVGPSIVHRNRKRFPLSQSTLREEFVEKKYQVFDIIGLLTILVQANLSLPRWSEFKNRGVLEAVNHNIGAASACRSARRVQK